MLENHLSNREAYLIHQGHVPGIAGHAMHKGYPREVFIREFLSSHLSETIAVGTGEIIDADSRPGQRRNQIDIVLYKRNYPKIDFGGGTYAFLAESVVATIEVKSCLNKQGLGKAIQAARSVKGLQSHLITTGWSGYQPPSILNYVVAYDCPSSMQVVHGWMHSAHSSLRIDCPTLPLGEGRLGVASPSLDGVFVLGKGFVLFDNSALTFISDEERSAHPDGRWAVASCERGALLALFLQLTVATSGWSICWVDPTPYLDPRGAKPEITFEP